MKLPIMLTVWLLPGMAVAQGMQEESGVPEYTLPALLQSEAGKDITTAKEWERVRRPEILSLFANEVFGITPASTIPVTYTVRSEEKLALAGKATRKEITFRLPQGKSLELLLYIPNHVKGRVPAFVGLNFAGNHTVETDPGIKVTEGWVRNNAELGITDNKARAENRGSSARRWPVAEIIERGYAVATMYYGEIYPDHPEGGPESIQTLFPQSTAPDTGWKAIGAWAWGLSRILDYLQTDARIDGKKVAVIGHSRLGKAAVWAGVQDPRFAMVISNNSGEGGAAITRRKFGETIQRINTAFPHWFAGNYEQYNNKEEELPVDYHQLIALVAPRPVYVASASEDLWADPKGEYLSAMLAGEVYRLYRKPGLTDPEPPSPMQPVGTKWVGYHIREGKHDILLYDWEQYMRMADQHFKK